MTARLKGFFIMTPFLFLSKLIDGFLLAKEIAGMSHNTIRNYKLNLGRLSEAVGPDRPVNDITVQEMRLMLKTLQTRPTAPNGAAPRPAKPLSPKTIRNIHTCYSSFWSWCISEGYAETNIMDRIKPPAAPQVVIEPLSQQQIKAIMFECRRNRQKLRDMALISFLLDNGARVSEICNLKIRDVDLRERTALIFGKTRMSGGENKQRLVPFGSRTAKRLWKYLATRDHRPNDFLFVNPDGTQIDRRVLSRHLTRLGKRAGVVPCNPHRFRHTFAIEYLRPPNSGDIFTLQKILGHSSLEMVRRYLAIAQIDIQEAHRIAGPVDNWRI